MATLILSTVGTAVGGPIGSAIGAVIGQQIDQAIFGGGSREGPRLKELSVTTSSYGQPIPRNFGRMRVAGSVIWSTELVETSTKEGGGKGKPSTKTYSYSVSFAVALSSTPIDRIGRIWADGKLLRGASGDLKVGGAMRGYLGTGDNPVDPVIAADRGASAPAFRDCAHVVFEDLQLGEFGNRIPALTFEIFAPNDSTVSLGEFVPKSTSDSNGLLLANARGFSDEGGSLGASLSAIDRVFPLTCVTTANGLDIASTTSIPADVPTLPEQLSTRDSNDASERHKQRGETVGNEPLALRYYDEGRDYQPGIQRALGLRPEGRETVVDLPAAMTAEGARELANSNAQRARWHDERVVWRIGELDPGIVPGAVVRLPDTNGFWLVRSWEWFERGIELGLERIAPDLGTIAATDPGTANTPVDLTAPPTVLEMIEVPSDGTTNPNNPVMFAAASASNAGWRGAGLFVEQGASLISIGSTGSERAMVGTLSTELSPSQSLLFEPNAQLEIDLVGDDFILASTDVTGLAMGANRLLIGGEVLQFLDAESISPRRWMLSGLLRGRAGTEDAASAPHSANSPVTLLDDRLVNLDPSEVPSAPETRIAAIGLGDDEPVFAPLQNAGLSRRPPMPVSPRQSVLADGSTQYCWTRRARGHWQWIAGSDVPLVEEQELYSIGYGPVDAPFAAWSSQETQFALSTTDAVELVTSFGQGSLWVKQVGTFGRSSALLLASLN